MRVLGRRNVSEYDHRSFLQVNNEVKRVLKRVSFYLHAPETLSDYHRNHKFTLGDAHNYYERRVEYVSLKAKSLTL